MASARVSLVLARHIEQNVRAGGAHMHGRQLDEATLRFLSGEGSSVSSEVLAQTLRGLQTAVWLLGAQALEHSVNERFKLHIPRDLGHRFHAMPDTIPRHPGHRYARCRTPLRSMPDVFGPLRGIG